MATRKVQSVGGGTYTVSLPKGWATDHGLDAGTEVTLTSHDGALVVRPPGSGSDRLTSARVSVPGDDPDAVAATLRAAHAAGFERVTLDSATAFTADQRRAARETAAALVGADVESEPPGEIRLEALLDPRDVSVSQSISHLQFVALAIHREGVAAAADGDAAAHERLRERVGVTRRLRGMLTRHVERAQVSLAEPDRLGVSRTRLRDFAAVGRTLDRVAEQGVRLAATADDGPLPEETAAVVRDHAADARDAVRDATGAMRDGDAAAAREGLAAASDARAATDALDAPTGQAGRVLSSVARTASEGERLARVALRAAVRSTEE